MTSASRILYVAFLSAMAWATLTAAPPAATAAPAATAPAVTPARVPNGGLQPQAATDAKGVVHLIYLAGDPAACDVFYVRSADGGATWSQPARVNSEPGSAIAVGTVRGAHLALGADGRVHVAWMGSSRAQPRAPGGASPMLYSRSVAESGDKADKGDKADGKVIRFEPQRNVITSKVGVDGGGSVAADARGDVYVAWHAPEQKGGGEASRRVWVAVSHDGGATFAPEVPLSEADTGACGCCGMDVLAGTDGRLYALYRAATEQVHRDIYLTALATAPGSTDAKSPAAPPAGRSQKVGPTKADTCMMSTAALVQGPHGVVGAWETRSEVQWGVIDPKTGQIIDAINTPARNGKHPAIAVNHKGETLIAWAEGTGWNRGGSVAWQVYDAQGKPIAGASGKKEGLPAWGKPAAFAKADGSIIVLY